jgi:hypothetical protein
MKFKKENMIENISQEDKAEMHMKYRLFANDNEDSTPSAAELSDMMSKSNISNKSELLRSYFSMRGKLISVII